MVAPLIIDNAGRVAMAAIGLLEQKAEDWKQVVPEAHDFHRECIHFRNIIEALQMTPGVIEKESSRRKGAPRKLASIAKAIHISVKLKQFKKHAGNAEETRPLNNTTHDNSQSNSSYGAATTEVTTKPKPKHQQRGTQAIVAEITEHIDKSQKRLDKFIKEHEKKKSWHLQIRWMFRRALIAKEHRDFIRDESNAIRHLLNDLVLCQKLAETAATPSIDLFQADLTEEPYMFWKKHIGQNIVGKWSVFFTAYSLLYGQMDQYDLAYAERTLKSQHGGDEVTIYSFISFTRKHGFPFKKSIAKATPETEPPLSEEARMEITKMVMNMVTDFSKEEMRKNVIALYSWFDGIKRSDEEGHQQRANEWATLVKETRRLKEEDYTERHGKAVEVDRARRELSFFYQRYMVMWRVGQVSREAIKDIDFPGKARINDFLRMCKPLDKANYHIIIGKKDNWEIHAKPKVYKFLEKLLQKPQENKKTQFTEASNSNNQQQNGGEAVVQALNVRG
ncbi:hypothetical protein INT45_007420 [Circinella minor]|uniref:Uncharacterized protein n=1 Tax=Circinella minor TaxID=1195481 RepID=A0A8H7SD73_9FUNG|nr:hypothetical protein INT45_007420 [Circinella minor]